MTGVLWGVSWSRPPRADTSVVMVEGSGSYEMFTFGGSCADYIAKSGPKHLNI